MTKHKIYVHDLYCYEVASEEQLNSKLNSPNRYFDLNKLPTVGLREEMCKFLFHRGEVLSLGSIRAEFWPYNVLCKFLTDKYPNLQSFLDVDLDVITRRLKGWLLNNGYNLSKRRKSRQYDKIKIGNSDVVLFLKRLYEYMIPEPDIPEIEKDVWIISKLGFPVRNNPVHPMNSLNFTSLIQEKLRNEVKTASAMNLSFLTVHTVSSHIRAVKRFSEFLASEYPKINSLTEVDREVLEEYLVYLNTEVDDKKSFCSELKSLKSLLDTVGKIEECRVLCNLFLPDDISKGGALPQYKSYSDHELMRLNAAIVEMDEQVARVLILHQMLGTRISETLTLEQNCLVKINKHWHVRAYQHKTFKPIYKPVNEDVIKLIKKSIQYTKEHYGERQYVFVYDKDPTQPMRYGKIQYRIMAMVQDKKLCDDEGKLFGVGTHTFRHSYGRKLTEMNVDDQTIAKLLGHANTSSVKYYRKYGNQALADATRDVRKSMDEILGAFVEEW